MELALCVVTALGALWAIIAVGAVMYLLLFDD